MFGVGDIAATIEDSGVIDMRSKVGKIAAMLLVVVMMIWPGGGAYAQNHFPTGKIEAGIEAGIEKSGYARIVVRYRDGVQVRSLRTLNESFLGSVVDEIPSLNAVVVQVPAERLDAALSILRNDPNVLYAEPDAVAHIAFTPNDPEYPVHQYGPQIIQADKAWDITRGDPNVLVAVVDTGVDYTHPDLQGKVVKGYDFVNNDADPADDNGHGTHVAGIIAAATNNGVGVASIGFNTRVLAVKVLDANGSGYYSTVAKGITYAADHGARIINLSLRGTVSSSILQDAVNYAWNKGVLVVAAAGNDGSNAPAYPAAYPHVLAVAATDWNDTRWSLSNYGDYIDVSAPGVGIISTDWVGAVGLYASRSGTSMAAPHVAAVAALALAVNPNLTNADLETLIKTSVDDKGDPGWDPYYGAGRVNAYKAVLAAQEMGRNVANGTIGDLVWVDANGNGIQDADEPGLANVIVKLYQADGTLVASTTTDQNGAYAFTDLPAGDYYLQVVSPGGYVFTLANQGTDDTVDSDVDRATGKTTVISLAAGQSDTRWDAGLIPTVRLSGVTWIDPNANGLVDPNEVQVVPDVPVHITGTDITGATVDVTVNTDANGRYEMAGLLPGTYQMEVPAHFGGYIVTTPNPQTITLTALSQQAVEVNFGFLAPTWVNMLAFITTSTEKGVQLRWKVSLGGAIPAFHVWRSSGDDGWIRLTESPLLPVSENGDTALYEFNDENVHPGHTYYYRLKATDGTAFGPWSVYVPPFGNTNTGVMFLPFMSR